MNSLKISQKAINTPASAIRKLVPLADDAKKRGIDVYHVNIGQPDLPTPKKILNFLKKFEENTLVYAPSQGIKEVREAWQFFYKSKGLNFDIKDIIITAGGSEALIFAFNAIADPDDEIIVFEPFYTSYAIIAAMSNINLKPVITKASDGFHFPKKEIIEKHINRKTKGIIVCNPNNPTGTLYNQNEVKMIVDIAKQYNLFIISDETYQEIVFDGRKVTPFAEFSGIEDRLIITDSVSKRFNACGARIGVIVSKNQDVMSAVLRFAQSRLSVASIEQLSVISMLIDHKKYVEKIRDIYQKRRDTVLNELSKLKDIQVSTPHGAFYLMPKLPIDNSDRFAEFLLKEFHRNNQTVMIAPATGFYKSPGLGVNEIRIAYVLEESKLKKAMNLLALAIEEYQKKYM